MDHLRLWRFLAPSGLALIGLGVSVVGHATERRIKGASPVDWVLWGTGGLVLLNAGVSCFGEAVKHRTHAELSSRAGDGAS